MGEEKSVLEIIDPKYSIIDYVQRILETKQINLIS